MPLIVCCGCGHSAVLAKVSRKPVCSNCGSKAFRIHKRIKVWMVTERAALDRAIARHTTLAGLLYLASEWHYKPEWAATQYHKIFGVWPPRPYPLPTPATELIVHWAMLEKAKYVRERKAARIETLTPGN